jgi:hypothetical protein
MKSIEVKFNEALATLKEKASASKYNEVVEKYSTLPTLETKLNCVEAALAEVMKEAELNPLGLKGYQEFDEAAKKDPSVAMLFGGVELREVAAPATKTLLTEAEKAARTIKKHNGYEDNHGTGTFTESNTPKNIFAKGDRLLIESDFKRGKITADEKRVMLGEEHPEVASLTEGQKREYRFARTLRFSESDALKLAKM